MKICELLEYASCGGTSSGSIATSTSGVGGPMMPIIKRMPVGQSFFGPAVGKSIDNKQKKRKKRYKTTDRHK